MRSTWRMALALLVGATIATAGFVQVALAQEGDTGSTDEKVTFTWGSTGEPSSLNPMSGYLAEDFYFWTASYHLLIDWDENLGVDKSTGPGSGLVTEVEMSDDAMSYTYHLKDDIMWSDGKPLTAEDVAYSLLRNKDPEALTPFAEGIRRYLTPH